MYKLPPKISLKKNTKQEFLRVFFWMDVPFRLMILAEDACPAKLTIEP